MTYEFTDGGGAQPGNVEVNVGSDRSPTNAASCLAAAIEQRQGAGGSAAVSTSSEGGVVYVKPDLHWELKTFADSDGSDAADSVGVPHVA